MSSRFFYTIFLLVSFFNIKGFAQNSDANMEQILKEKRIFNQTNTKTEGYRIQLYNGLNENLAKSTRGAFVAYFPDISTKLFYEQPEWKVQTSPFKTKFEAYKTWLKVREEFDGTFIFETKK